MGGCLVSRNFLCNANRNRIGWLELIELLLQLQCKPQTFIDDALYIYLININKPRVRININKPHVRINTNEMLSSTTSVLFTCMS